MSLSISDTQHNNTMPCADGHYAERCVLFTMMLSVIMLSVIMLNVVMLSVVAPLKVAICQSFKEEEKKFNDIFRKDSSSRLDGWVITNSLKCVPITVLKMVRYKHYIISYLRFSDQMFRIFLNRCNVTKIYYSLSSMACVINILQS